MKIVFFGDSNTYGYTGLTAKRNPDRFTKQLAKRHPDWEIVEEGLSGRTLANDDPFALPRNGAKQIDMAIRSHMPFDVLVVMLGTNDAKQIFHSNLYFYQKQLRTFLLNAANPALKMDCPYPSPKIIMLQPPLPHPDMLEKGNNALSFGQEGFDLLSQYGSVLESACAPFGIPVITHDIAAGPADGLHMDTDGHTAMTDLLDHYFETEYSH